MPPKIASIVKEKRANETAEERQLRLEKNRNRISKRRNIETKEERESRLQEKRDKESSSQATETTQKHDELNRLSMTAVEAAQNQGPTS
ncbi:Protein of unknown function [Cotesia congregata]|uniref:Uncharacterized protein n=1 Tax=Cotesia congregata TaxID=51543 RepID=A0A8J2MTZ1_COTCN|nr:Protein of unknown function [Cotesia congregata]